ncbi:MAG: lysophospholipase, partial [Lachnospiraceae bacterium]|nr:lysophospholipase [Lachnospiraceae bacterium]
MKTILLLITVIFLVLTIRHLMLKFFMNIVIGRKTFNFRQFDKEKYHQLAPADDFSDDWITKQELTTLRINSSRDGVNLSGHFLLAEEPVRTIILFHGWRSEFKCDFAEMAENLNRNGCNLLFVEQRAHGNSGGKYIGFGALERYDCIDWLKYLTDTNHNLPIYLAGLSMG